MASNFVKQYLPYARKIEQETGVPAALILAQASLESADGKQAPGYNFFGIKGQGPAGSQRLLTTEIVNGRKVKVYAPFRKYNSPEEAFRDHARLISSSPNYARVMAAAKNGTLQDVAKEIGNSPYATDPDYGKKIWTTMKRNEVLAMQPDYKPQTTSQKTGQQISELPKVISSLIAPKAMAAESLPFQKLSQPTPQTKNFSLQDFTNMPTPSQAPQIIAQSPQSTVVQKGDTLWGISKRLTGSGANWRNLTGYSGDPRQLPIGAKISIGGQ